MSLSRLSNQILLVGVLLILFQYEVMSKENQNIKVAVYRDSLNLKKYIGGQLEKFFFDFKNNGFEKYFLDEPPGSLMGVIIKFNSHYTLHIFLKKLKYVRGVNKERNWDWEQLKKERINSIEVYEDGELVKSFR